MTNFTYLCFHAILLREFISDYTEVAMKKSKKGMLNALFLMILIAATLYVTLHDQNIGQIFQSIHNTKKTWLILAIFLVFLYVLSESVIIKYLMHVLKKTVSFFRCAKYSFIGFFYSCITPSASGGQPMQVFYMQRDGLDVSVSALVLLIITVGYKAILVIMSAWMFLFDGSFILSNLGSVRYIFIYGVSANVIFIAFLLVLIFHEALIRSFLFRIVRLLAFLRLAKDPKKLQEKLLNIMEPYHSGAVYIRGHLSVLFHVVWLSAIQRLALFLVPWCVYRAMGLQGYSAFEIVTLQTIIALSVDMLPLPGGVGAAETSFEIMFTTIFGSALVIPGMLLSRGISYYFLVAVSGIITVIAHIKITVPKGERQSVDKTNV